MLKKIIWFTWNKKIKTMFDYIQCRHNKYSTCRFSSIQKKMLFKSAPEFDWITMTKINRRFYYLSAETRLLGNQIMMEIYKRWYKTRNYKE